MHSDEALDPDLSDATRPRPYLAYQVFDELDFDKDGRVGCGDFLSMMRTS